jgi:hypothetical protein
MCGVASEGRTYYEKQLKVPNSITIRDGDAGILTLMRERSKDL